MAASNLGDARAHIDSAGSQSSTLNSARLTPIPSLSVRLQHLKSMTTNMNAAGLRIMLRAIEIYKHGVAYYTLPIAFMSVKSDAGYQNELPMVGNAHD